MEIHFTKHAQEKFAVLARHGVQITHKKVLAVVKTPQKIDYSRLPMFIAQGNLGKSYILRVVYKKEQDIITVITFYPGRKSQYEKEQ